MVGDANWLASVGAAIQDSPMQQGIYLLSTIGGSTMGQVESFLQRPKSYNNIDGVGELGIGCMLLGFALLQWLQVSSPPNAIWHKVYVVVPFILLMASIIDQGSK